jgi:uncharacterized protein YidB (DUF937 family)
MGLLDMLTGGQSRQRGGVSPITLGLLALLAYRTYQGKGRLADMLGRNAPGAGNGEIMPPAGRGSAPLQAGQPPRGGMAGNREMMEPGERGAAPLQPGPSGGGFGDLLRSGLGGLLGGAAAGTLLNGGLGDLLRRFQQNGFGDTANSWVNHGPNREITPGELESAVGPDALQDLSQETGKSYEEILQELSRSLPNDVDQLTPEGRLPTDDEAQRWV